MAFWQTTASVNLSGHVGKTDYDDGKYKGLNGVTDRCCAYNHCLALLTEKKFPDLQGKKILEFPNEHEARGIRDEKTDIIIIQ